MSLEATLVRRLRDFVLDLEISVGDGETLALLGANGSGKTTVLNLVAGLLRPDDGRIVLNGRALFDTGGRIDLAPEERRIGLVFQDYALFPHLSVRKNVAFGLAARRIGRHEIEERVDRELEALGLLCVADHPATRLSGGQRQRVALARSLVIEPDLVLLDEPFAALDARLRPRLRQELRETIRSAGIPAILVTHSPADVRACADRVSVIERGRLIPNATPAATIDSSIGDEELGACRASGAAQPTDGDRDLRGWRSRM
ncbi:MAG: ABC transporter ATP-binding protein [Methanospirillum sp.]